MNTYFYENITFGPSPMCKIRKIKTAILFLRKKEEYAAI